MMHVWCASLADSELSKAAVLGIQPLVTAEALDEASMFGNGTQYADGR